MKSKKSGALAVASGAPGKQRCQNLFVKSPRSIDAESCRIVAEVLAPVGSRIVPGVLTRSLMSWPIGSGPAMRNRRSRGTEAISETSPVLGFDRRQVVHGFRTDGCLRRSDCFIDVGVKRRGITGMGQRHLPWNDLREEESAHVTEESLAKGIQQAMAGNHLHDVSHAVQQCVEASGFNVVRDLVGHGIGRDLHEEPPIPNYGTPGTGVLLKEGMALAIEPMVNTGTHRVEVDDDGWTIRTTDGKPSAHFEHTIIVRKGEADILAKR
jgi:methionyl aminopeptidase